MMKMPKTIPLLLLQLAAAATPAVGQVVRGVVLEAGTASPVEGAMVVLLDLDGTTVDRVLTDPTGAFIADADRPGPHLIRIDRIGYESITTERFDVPVTGTFQRVEVPIRPVQLEGLSVEGSRRCSLRGQQGPATERVWEEARKALEAASWTQSSGAYRYTLLQFQRRLDAGGRRALSERRQFIRGTGQKPYVSVPAERLAAEGFIAQNRDNTITYYAPDADAFLSDAFLDTHCMNLREGEEGMIGLAFEPIRGRRLPEIRGTLWIEAATAELRRLEFTYVNRPYEHDVGDAGGQVTFDGLPNGTWVVRDWSVRMPLISTDPSRTRRAVMGYEEQGGQVWRVIGLSGDVILEAASATIAGTVVDSLGSAPASGAIVRSDVAEESEARTGADGAYRLSGLPEGLQTLSVYHPSLDTLGLGPVTFEVDAPAGTITSADVRLPGVLERLSAACVGEEGTQEPGAILFGRVLVDGRPAAGARVRVGWLASNQRFLDVSTHAAPPRADEEPIPWLRDLEDADRLVAALDERGIFMLCRVPRGTQVRVEAATEGSGWTVRTVTLDPAHELVIVSVPVRSGG